MKLTCGIDWSVPFQSSYLPKQIQWEWLNGKYYLKEDLNNATKNPATEGEKPWNTQWMVGWGWQRLKFPCWAFQSEMIKSLILNTCERKVKHFCWGGTSSVGCDMRKRVCLGRLIFHVYTHHKSFIHVPQPSTSYFSPLSSFPFILISLLFLWICGDHTLVLSSSRAGINNEWSLNTSTCMSMISQARN